MRWTKLKGLHGKTQFGDTRNITKFLIFPKYIKGDLRWLETAEYTQMYVRKKYFGHIPLNVWETQFWVKR